MKRRLAEQSFPGHQDDHGQPAVVIGMAATALSGFVMGLLIRGQFGAALAALLLLVAAGCIGWWVRGS